MFKIKQIYFATMLAVLLSFSGEGMAIATDSRQYLKSREPEKITGPHSVTMETWSNIIRALRQNLNKHKNMLDKPTKPFRFDVGKDINNRFIL